MKKSHLMGTVTLNKQESIMFQRIAIILFLGILGWGPVHAGTAGITGLWTFSGSGSFYETASLNPAYGTTADVTGLFNFDAGTVSLFSAEINSLIWPVGTLTDDNADGIYRSYEPALFGVNGNPGTWDITVVALGHATLETVTLADVVVPSSWIVDDPAASGFVGFNLTGTLELLAVPVPAAVWLFGSGLLGLIGAARRKVHV